MVDVARLAGVSVKTVSNVLNGYPYIRETTRQRVLAAIEELGYQVNMTARSLRSARGPIPPWALAGATRFGLRAFPGTCPSCCFRWAMRPTSAWCTSWCRRTRGGA